MSEERCLPPLTPDEPFLPAEKPTMYFIGVTTHRSSIMRIFPRWAEYLGLGDVAIRGINLRPHDEPENYRKVVRLIRQDPCSLGALVTTHKIDLLKACRDLFDRLDPLAEVTGEISCISKDGTEVVGHAKDPITSGLALEAFLPPGHWERTSAEVLVLGAGGSARAITWYLLQKTHGNNRPARITITNRTLPRLEEMRRFHQMIGADLPLEYYHTPLPESADPLVGRLPPQSLVINATGLGKDAPGSPITDRG